MKIATWNCNSIRARTARLLAWLSANQPDVLCLQELKCLDSEFPTAEVQAAGYYAVCFGQKTYNGVAILSKLEPTNVVRGVDAEEDGQARLIAATVGSVRVMSAYAPNGQSVDSPAYQFKLKWFDRLRKMLDANYSPADSLALCGDWNVAPEPIDVHDPALWEGQTLFSLPERAALKHLCDFGLVDAFRKHHAEGNRYTWWDYRMLGFPKNKGLRIDHILVTAPLAAACVRSEIDREARKGTQPSDHAPLWAEVSPVT